MKSISKIIGILALALLAFSCVKEKTEELAPGTFYIDTDTYGTIGLDQNKQLFVIPVKTNIAESEWTISSSEEWCKAGYSINAEKGLMIAVDDNTDKEKERSAQVSVQAGSNAYTLKVIQLGYGPAIIVTNVSVGPEGGEVVLNIVSNVEIDEAPLSKPSFNREDGENWIVYQGKTKAFATSSYSYMVDMNELPDKREAKVSVKAKDPADAEADKECLITQSSISVTATEIFSSTKVNVLSAKANQDDPNYSGHPEALVDGNYGTFYHSPAGVGGTVFPVVWEFEFFGDQRIDYINIMHRGYQAYGDHWRGQIGSFNVYYKTAGSDYTFSQKFDFGGKGGYQTASLSQPIENATWVKIEIEDGDPSSVSYTDGRYIACAEVEFFTSNRMDVNNWISRIFKDPSCSELKDGVTKKDIIQMNAVSPYLATNVAIPLLNGTYNENEKDFRIHSYEPYSDSHVNKDLVMQFYTSMDNPTGIEVKSGKDIIVCVDKIPANQTVSLRIYGEADEYGPNYGGGGETESINQETQLQEGVNTVRITADGMAYVMNMVPVDNRAAISTFQNVKVHILPGCGTVQGYFDPARHSDDRYKELLNKCTYPYFLVKGEKCMFLFHTNQLRSDWPSSIRSGIGVWDDIVRWQHELMGLDKVKWFNNHMMAVTSSNPDVYMNATNRRVQFGVSTIKEIGSREKMQEGTGQGNIWGPAHEMGHVNQMAINWRSTTESSNNLFSNYCVMKLAGDTFYTDKRWSRGKTIKDLAEDYAAGKPWAVLGTGNYQGEDPELHMRMNWQLWNYYQNCGYKSDFFPALFAYFRDGHQLPNQSAMDYYGRVENAGLCQLEYYEACCKVAGQDLTDFFDAWGFFRTIDQTYSQYGETKYTVTDIMINASKARVRDMKLPKAAPIQYLEDRTKHGGETFSEMGYWTQFKDKVTISKSPKATVNGRKVSLTDCDQAVAVELRRGTAETGDLLYFANLFNFEVPASVSLSGNTLWAVQYDGKRVKVQQ